MLNFCTHDSTYIHVKDRHLDTEKLFAYKAVSRSFLSMLTTPRDSCVSNYRELTTLLTQSESLAEGGVEPLIIGSM